VSGKAVGSSTTGTTINYGVSGHAAGADDSTNYGVRALADGATSGTNYGLHATASGGGTNYAGYFDGNVRVIGTISSNRTSYHWFGGFGLTLNGGYYTLARIDHYSPSANNVGRIYRSSGTGQIYTQLPLSGLPQSVYGKQTALSNLLIYYVVDSGEYIDSTEVFIGNASVLLDTTNRTSTTLTSYFLTIPAADSAVTGDVTIVFRTYHAATGATNNVTIPRVRAALTY
jgi:hypothetical protein